MTLTTILFILSIIASYVSIFDDLNFIDKKLELEHYKLKNKENIYKYLIPIIPSLIPIFNIITAFAFTETKDEYYESIKKFKCLLLMNDKIKNIYDTLDSNEKKELEYKLGIANYLINVNGIKKNEVFDRLARQYEKDIVYYKVDKANNTLVELNDNCLNDDKEISKKKVKIKKLVI